MRNIASRIIDDAEQIKAVLTRLKSDVKICFERVAEDHVIRVSVNIDLHSEQRVGIICEFVGNFDNVVVKFLVVKKFADRSRR